MSRAALDWAFRQHPPKPSDKLVLLILADAADRHSGECFPSTAGIVAASGLDRKMVLASLARLQRVDLLTDTGQRIGRTGQIKVWWIPAERSPIGDA